MRGRVAVAIVLCLSLTASAQQGLDRKKVPPAGPTPVLRVPAWTRGALANGAELIVSEKHDLPLISFSITFLGGDNQFEPAGKQGVASLTAALLTEGTKARNGEALSNALQLLATSVMTNGAHGTETPGFASRPATLAPMLDLLVDTRLTSASPAAGLRGLRDRPRVALTQPRAQPDSIASLAFPRIVFGGNHPYG